MVALGADAPSGAWSSSGSRRRGNSASARIVSLSPANKRSLCYGGPLARRAGRDQQYIQQQRNPRRNGDRRGNLATLSCKNGNQGLDGLGQTSPSTRKIGERWPSGYWVDRRTSTRNQRRIGPKSHCRWRARAEGEEMSAPEFLWTPEKDGLLRSMGAAGESTAAIATLLKRTPDAVRRRARFLKIKLARSPPGLKGK